MKTLLTSKKFWIAVVALIAITVAELAKSPELEGTITTVGGIIIAAILGAVGGRDYGKGASALLLFASLSAQGCGLFEPVAKSPCDGLYCVGVEIAGVPGSTLICYQDEAEARQWLAIRDCTLEPSAKRAVCR